MPLSFLPESPSEIDLVRNKLSKLASRPNGLADGVEDVQHLTIDERHAIYDLRLDEVLAGGGVDSARQTGVRYLILDSNGPVAAAELIIGDPPAVSINFGQFVGATARALSALSASDELAGRLFEVRLLRFSALYLVALWLSAEDGRNLLYPLAPSPPPLDAGQQYTKTDLNVLLFRMAQGSPAGARAPGSSA
jgi:hypothetical protein